METKQEDPKKCKGNFKKSAKKPKTNLGLVIKSTRKSFIKINQIFPSTTNSDTFLRKSLKATVLSKSDEFVTKDNKSFWKILLSDETGFIYAIIYHDNIGDVLDKMQIGRTYCIDSPVVRKYDPNYAVKTHINGAQLILRNANKIKIFSSKIRNCKKHIPFQFTDLRTIPSLAKKTPVDLIGFVSDIHWDIDEVAGWEFNNDEYKKLPPRQFILCDALNYKQGNKLRCTVWGNQALKVTSIGSVIILQGVKVSQLYCNYTGVNVGNTSEIHFINKVSDMWMLSPTMEEFYWKLFPGEHRPLNVREEAQQVDGDEHTKQKRKRTPNLKTLKGTHLQFDGNASTMDLSLPFPSTSQSLSLPHLNRDSSMEGVDKENLINIKIRPSKKFMDVEDPKKYPNGVYRMRSNPRGIALIINNLSFPNHPLGRKDRLGSYNDKCYMETLFGKMGFWVTIDVDLCTDKFSETIDIFKKRLEAIKAEAVVVVIMSHGQSNFVELTDGNNINLWNDVVYQFNDELCPFLVGKPKFFIFQTCQNFGPTSSTIIGSKSCVMKDTLVSFATLPGSKAARNNQKGSWFIVALAKVFMENAHNKHLMQLMEMLQRQMVSYFGTQQCFWIPFLFDKPLFFNPGLSS